MPRLETGLNNRSRFRLGLQCGYSLIELLIVLLIAGLLSTLAVLRFSGDSEAERAEDSLNRLAASIELLCDQALLSGQVHGIRLSSEGYDFWRLSDNRWQRLPNDRAPRARTWPDDLPVEVEIEQRRLTATPSGRPQLWCSALEPIASLEVRLGRGNARQIRRWPADAR